MHVFSRKQLMTIAMQNSLGCNYRNKVLQMAYSAMCSNYYLMYFQYTISIQSQQGPAKKASCSDTHAHAMCTHKHTYKHTHLQTCAQSKKGQHTYSYTILCMQYIIVVYTHSVHARCINYFVSSKQHYMMATVRDRISLASPAMVGPI